VSTLPIAWLVVRAAGLVAFGLLTLSVWLGLAMSTKLLPPRWSKQLLGLHRTLAWTGLSFIALHVVALLFDPMVNAALVARLAVPLAAGVLAGWLSLMLAVSFRLRKWIGQKGWRRLHYASFLAFALSLGHSLLAGSDLHGLGGPVLALLAAGPVLWLGFYRLLVPRVATARTSSVAA
jgi:methionine sulfoxide reductase heme-binding subunit